VSLTSRNTRNLCPPRSILSRSPVKFLKGGESEYRFNDVAVQGEGDPGHLFMDTGVSTTVIALHRNSQVVETSSRTRKDTAPPPCGAAQVSPYIKQENAKPSWKLDHEQELARIEICCSSETAHKLESQAKKRRPPRDKKKNTGTEHRTGKARHWHGFFNLYRDLHEQTETEAHRKTPKPKVANEEARRWNRRSRD